MSWRVIPPTDDEKWPWSWLSCTRSACLTMHQNPSTSPLRGWNHTGASRRSTSNMSWGTAGTKLSALARSTS